MKKILVVGDLAIDRYYKGKSKGLSPEGPYCVVLNPEETLSIGCAGNVAVNVKSMFPSIHVDIFAVIGKDSMGSSAKSLLSWHGVGTTHILEQDVITITKNRLVADGISIARWDHEMKDNLKNKIEAIQKMADMAKEYDCIIFSDYNKGMISDKLVVTARLNKLPNCKILVDPKKKFDAYKLVDLIKPNMKELIDYEGCEDISDPKKIDKICNNIMSKYQIKNVLLTKSDKGMSLYSGSKPLSMPSKARAIVDVTGAGDIVMAAVAGFWTEGKTLQEACRLANIAAGISVSKFGTSKVTMTEIEEELKHVKI